MSNCFMPPQENYRGQDALQARMAISECVVEISVMLADRANPFYAHTFCEMRFPVGWLEEGAHRASAYDSIAMCISVIGDVVHNG